ncbi:hypothetical protein [Rhodovulum sulfidophilum]|uniref:hypothetical protein n=1 Tax=Rhodovulum sulfidophilum TaxID=35806 RepID=UPI0019212568|nr:hypothetical protein [Rhodovulum sulfidophilum]MBL3561077.1 hypothetical protein [Rhodovulum sulfidophilum]
MLIERFEISGDDDLDLRSEEEKARAAVTNWMRWQGYLGHLNRWQQAAIWGAVREQTALIRDRQPSNGRRAGLRAGLAQAGRRGGAPIAGGITSGGSIPAWLPDSARHASGL